MPSPSAILFPFRRLAVWLGILVLAVAGLALAISALVVLPSLERNLVAQRVQAVARQARDSAPLFEGDRSARRRPTARGRSASRGSSPGWRR